MTDLPSDPAPPNGDKENQIGAERVEAFSDGVLAVIITIMVLELKAPHEADLESLRNLLPTFLSYVLSFLYIGIYWNNHHHLMRRAEQVDGAVMWANLNLLFWLSLIPFVTSWMGEHYTAVWPTVCYGVVLFMAAVSYTILATALVRLHGKDSLLATRLGSDLKGKVSLVCYVCAIFLGFLNHWLADGLFLIVAILWFIPDRRLQ